MSPPAEATLQRRQLLALAALPLGVRADARTVNTRVDTPLGPFVVEQWLKPPIAIGPVRRI